MTITYDFIKPHLYVTITWTFNISKVHYQVLVSDRPLLTKAKPVIDYIHNFEQSGISDSEILKSRKRFFTTLIAPNLASYNRYIFKIEKEINNLYPSIHELFISHFGI